MNCVMVWISKKTDKISNVNYDLRSIVKVSAKCKQISPINRRCYTILSESQYCIPVSTQKKYMQPCSTGRSGRYISHTITQHICFPPEILFRIFAIEFNREATLCCCILWLILRHLLYLLHRAYTFLLNHLKRRCLKHKTIDCRYVCTLKVCIKRL